jgi:NADP-dependent 3-hydroxy acid dehydrogenase YdfG
MQDQAAIADAIATLPIEWSRIDILVNNAGLALSSEPFHKADLQQWNTMIDTNVKGLLCMTHAVLQGMIERNSGHIINIGSIAGRQNYPGGNVYCASKHAVKSISQSLRIDLSGYAIRVTEIAPGAVNTEFSTVRWNDKTKADKFYEDFKPLWAQDIADTILFCVTRPSHVNIAELVVYPTDQADARTLNRQ